MLVSIPAGSKNPNHTSIDASHSINEITNNEPNLEMLNASQVMQTEKIRDSSSRRLSTSMVLIYAKRVRVCDF